jgi:hypothetical protein
MEKWRAAVTFLAFYRKCKENRPDPKPSEPRSSDSNFDKTGRIIGLFGFHNLKPTLDGFLDVRNSFFIGLPLGQTSGKSRDFGDIISGLILLDDNM